MVAQWVKKPTSAAQDTVEAWVPSPALCSGLEDSLLPQLWHRWQLRLRFSPWPRNFHMLWAWPKKPPKKPTSDLYIL